MWPVVKWARWERGCGGCVWRWWWSGVGWGDVCVCRRRQGGREDVTQMCGCFDRLRGKSNRTASLIDPIK